ncbi:MAG: DUF349 domain-containing protein [Bacteroidales bacterium]
MMNEQETTKLDLTNEVVNTLDQPLAEDKEVANFTSRTEIIKQVKNLLTLSLDEIKTDIETLKQNYYKLRKQEVDSAKALYMSQNDNSEEGFSPEEDLHEEELKELLNEYKKMKSDLAEERLRIREENLQAKRQIIESLKEITEDAEDVSKRYTEFHHLQVQWKEITDIPAEESNELWKQYHHYVELFYELLKINKELRDYDYRRNLELKSILCESAEKLASEDDVISSFHQLQKLHEEWREIGPVSKESRDEIWRRFKEASTVVNKRHQHHFEQLKNRERENELEKIAICEAVEQVNTDPATTFQMWDKQTETILELQAKWKTLGFAPKKVNNGLYDRFRLACNKFFDTKAEFYANSKRELESNLEKKIALCEKAEAIKDSTEWRKTTDKLVTLQKEWKTIGAVPRKQSDEVWKRFIAACDSFFERKGKEHSSQKSEERTNLKKKHDLIEKLTQLKGEGTTLEVVREIITEFNAVGHVPFKEKDKVYKEFHGLVDELFEVLNVNRAKKRMETFTSEVESGEKSKDLLLRDRERLVRTFEYMNNDLKTFENNIGFLTSSSKSGNSLVREIEKKIEKLKEEMTLIVKKIDIIDTKLNQ